MDKYLKAGSRLSIFHRISYWAPKATVGKISLKKAQELFQTSYFCMCQDGLSATCYCSKHSLCQRSLQHFGHLQDTLDQAMSHSRGSVCKDFSETEVQITSVGALISPIELRARLINYLQLFWSVLKLFISAVPEVWSICFARSAMSVLVPNIGEQLFFILYFR